MARSGLQELLSRSASETYYNLLVQGFRDGQLSLKKEIPPGFTQLADPYDPSANALYEGPPYRMLDVSYYKGRLFLYFGITPALILFWPYVALTGQYLLHRQAVMIFCTVGFLASVGLLHALWRRYFAEVSVGVVVACALALGLATGLPVLLSWADVYQVAITCGYMLTMLALVAIWRALHEPEPRKRSGWLATASAAYGLAVGARPSLLFGAVILLVPVAQGWRERRHVWAALLAATIPITFIGLGLMFYNYLRFGSPFEFGQHYQLGGEPQVMRQFFRLQYLWFNFRLNFLEPARWSAHFPFARNIAVPPIPVGYGRVERPFGLLTNVPVVWLALAVPLAWRGRSGAAGPVLRWFAAAVALLFGVCASTLLLYESAMFRYQVDFLPAFVLLAVIGILGVERALADRSSTWQKAARCGWGLLLVFSVGFNLLATADNYAEAHDNMGVALGQAGNVPEALEHFEQALRLKPDFAEAHYNMGVVLAGTGRMPEAMNHWEQALRIKSDFAAAHYNLGLGLEQMGRVPEAIEHYQQALKFQSDFAPARSALARLGAGQ